MSCPVSYKREDLDNSKLFKQLKAVYGSEDKALHVYYDVIFNNSNSENSFLTYFNSLPVEEQLLDEAEPSFVVYDRWRKHIKFKARLSSTFITSNLVADETETIALNESFAHFMVDTLLEQGLDLNEIVSPNVNINNIINKSIKKLSDEMVKNVELQKQKQNLPKWELDRKELIRTEVLKNPILFIEQFQNYSSEKLNIRFDVENELYTLKENGEILVKDTAYNKTSIEFDTKDSAPATIKLLIASLIEKKQNGENQLNELFLPKVVDYNKTFNFLQHNLLDTPSTYEDVIAKLKELAPKHPFINDLIRKITFNKNEFSLNEDINRRISENQLIGQFILQFDKTKLNFLLHQVDADGNLQLKNENFDTTQRKLVNNWRNDYINKDYTGVNVDVLKVFSDEQILQFLRVSDEVDITKVDSEVFDAIREYGFASENSVKTIYESNSPVYNRLLEIANAVDTPNVIDFQVFNVEGKRVHAITMNSYITTVAKDFRIYAGNEAKLKELHPELFNSEYNQNSLLANRILESSKNKIEIGLFNGIKNVDENNTETVERLGESDLIHQRIIGMLVNGVYSFTRTADRGMEFYFKIPGKENRLFTTSREDAKQTYLGYLQDEIALSNSGIEIENFKNNNEKSRIFGYYDPILGYITINDYLNMSMQELADVNIYENKDISKFLDKMMDYIIAEESFLMTDHEILLDNHIETIKADRKLEDYSSEQLIEEYALNYHIANIEVSKMFTGDYAFYKTPEEVFKRLSMYNSTKNNMRTDAAINMLINSLEHIGENYEARTDNKIKTITISEVVSSYKKGYTDAEKDTLIEILGKGSPELAVYEAIEEGDGVGYITLNEYRRMLLRATEWTPLHEKHYQKVMRGDYSYDESLPAFTPKKYQYTGNLVNDEYTNVKVPAIRKFAFIPIIPGTYEKGSNMEKFNEQLLKSATGMAFLKSATKGIGVNKTHDVYDANDNFILELNDDSSYDMLDWKYIGDQLKIHNKDKSEIQGTQRNKLITANFYQNGKPINEETASLLEDYKNLQIKKAQLLFDKLKRKSGIGDGIEDPRTFIDKITKQGLLQNFNANELASMQLLLDENDDSLLPIEILQNRRTIESLITSTIKKVGLDNKRNGTALAQAPNLFYEKANVETRHDLKYYRYSKAINGKRELLPQEIIVPLPQELIQYVIDEYSKTNKLTKEALDEFNAVIAKDQENFENTLKTSELTSLVTYSGFRIPTQDMSSLDVMRVKRFQMPSLAGQITVSKAHVAKTGSDFDIDKMFLYKAAPKFQRLNYYEIGKLFLEDMKITDSIILKSLNDNLGYVPSENSTVNASEFINVLLNPDNNFAETESVKFYKQKFKQFYKERQGKITGYSIPTGKTTIQEVDNELLEIENKLILHESNHKKLMTPLTTHIIKKIADNIRGEGVKMNYSDIFLGTTNIRKYIAFLAGKAGVGQVAVHATNHSLAQQAGLAMNVNRNYFEVYNSTEVIEGEETKNVVDLSQVTDGVNENNISQVLSELLTAYVDIAKDNYILDINAVREIANPMLMMLRWGVPAQTVFNFLNQPVIKYFLKEQKADRGVYKNRPKLKRKDLIQKVLDEYAPGNSISNLTFAEDYIGELQMLDDIGDINTKVDKYVPLTEKVLENGLKGQSDASLQLQVFDLFLGYQEESKIFQEMIGSTGVDTKGFSNMDSFGSQIELIDKVKESGKFINYDVLINDTFLSEFQATKENAFMALQSVFMTQGEGFRQRLNLLKNQVRNSQYSDIKKDRASDKITSHFINHLLEKDSVIEHAKGINSMFNAQLRTSFPKIIKRLQVLEKDNLFLENVSSLLNFRNEGYDHLKLSEKSYKNDTLAKIRESLIELSEILEYGEIKNEEGKVVFQDLTKYGMPRKTLVENLWYFNMIQSSISNSPFSLTSIIPAEVHNKNVKRVVEKYKLNPEDVRLDIYTGFDSDNATAPSRVSHFIKNNPELLYGTFNHGYNRIKYLGDGVFKYSAGEGVFSNSPGLVVEAKRNPYLLNYSIEESEKTSNFNQSLKKTLSFDGSEENNQNC